MMIILSEAHIREDLCPFTLTRHTADIRCGILTIREKWTLLTGADISIDESIEGIRIPANLLPDLDNYKDIIEFYRNNAVTECDNKFSSINHPWQIFQLNDHALRCDYKLLTEGKTSYPLSATNKTISTENIFLEDGVQIEHCIINASAGPVYIAEGAVIMEGCMIRGPFALGKNSVLKMGTKIYGATTIGPNCVAGGEIKNSVMFGCSNKAHDGYLGDSVIGEWCNLGAGTSNSNVKNTGAEVSYQISSSSKNISAGAKGGLLMGDYSRAAINTSFNTGTVVGVCCNIFGQSFPGKYIDNFTWGNERYKFDKALRDINNWKKMKGQEVTADEEEMLRKLYNN